MARTVLMALMPWFAVLAVLLLVAWALAGFSRARLRLGRLVDLHADERGSAQTLAFVLTLPVFIMVMMMIVQVSQLMIGVIVVNYAAFASARAAAVWIPAAMPGDEGPNCISSYELDPTAPDQQGPAQQAPEMNPQAADYGPSNDGGETYLINPGSPKYQQISMAAVLACMAVSPSRDVGLQTGTSQASAVLKEAYASLAPSSQSNSMIGPRLDNKLAYALSATNVQIRFYHANTEPPLTTYYLPDDPGEFYSNEIGWQDMITVKVQYQFPLLPGPGRLLAKYVVGPSGQPDNVAKTIQKQGNVYVYPLEAQAVIGNEGEKSVVTYVYNAN